MNKHQYYPAIFVGAYSDALAALGRVGLAGDEARFCLAGCNIHGGMPCVFEVVIEDHDCRLSDLPVSKTAVVLMKRQDGLIGMWFGLFQFLRDSEEDALEALVEDLITHPEAEPPTVNIFEWSPVEVLQ